MPATKTERKRAAKPAPRRAPRRPASSRPRRAAAKPKPPRRAAPASRRRPTPAAIYAYCVVRGAQPRLDAAPAGLPDMSPPRALPLGADLWLVAAAAPARLYAAKTIAERSQDLDWLSACALAHEAVIEHVMSSPAVAPLKLFTLFSSPAVARRRLAARGAELSSTLDRLAGGAEWGVRVHARPRPVVAPRARDASGRQFLERKRDARRLAQESLAAVASEAQHGYDALARLAREARRLEPPPGAAPSLLLDAVFLVVRRRQASFHAAFEEAARRLAALDADVVLSGPWPAYHFVAEPR